MTEPLSLETLMSEFDKSARVWVLQDSTSKLYVTIPHERYPRRVILHFFMSEADAKTVLEMIRATGNKTIVTAKIVPIRVNLHEALKGIASSKTPGFADGFVVHPPNEVFEFWWPKN